MKAGQKLLHDLANNMTVVTESQARRAFFDDDAGEMRRTLRAHRAAGLISIGTEFVRSRISPAPIAVIERGAGLPSAHQIAYQGAKRWSGLLVPTVTIRGTMKLAALYGGEIRTVVAGHVSHEVALADVFLAKRSADTTFQWTLVHAAPGSGALPDAISGESAIELVGRYNGATVMAKLGISATCRLELW